MRISKAVAFTAALTLLLSAGTVSVSAETVKADIDPAAYEYMLKYDTEIDTNNDGMIDENELSGCKSLALDLENVKSIDWITKAESLDCIRFQGGTIQDFTALSNLKNLNNIGFTNVPISDISCLKDLDLQFLYLRDTKVPEEDQMAFVTFPDFETQAGYYEDFTVKPKGLFDGTFKIDDNSIAGFGEEGSAQAEESYYTSYYAKSPGETSYSAYAGDKKVGGGMIKVSKAEVSDPALTDGQVKSVRFLDNHAGLQVLNKKGDLYDLAGGTSVKKDSDVKNVISLECFSIDCNHNIEVRLYNNGELKADGESVSLDGKKVTDIIDDGSYAVCSDELYHLFNEKGKFGYVKICDNFSEFYDRDFVYLTDGSLEYINTSYDSAKFKIKDLGKIKVKTLISSYNNYILDTQNNYYKLGRVSFNEDTYDFDLIASNVSEIGALIEDGHKNTDVYKMSDGQLYDCRTDQKVIPADNYKIVDDYNYQLYYDSPFERKIYMEFEYYSTVNGVTIYPNDTRYGWGIIDKNNTAFLTMPGRCFAVTNVKDLYGAFYDEDNVYEYILRTDDTLWQYNITTGESQKVNFGDVSSDIMKGDIDLSGSVSASDFAQMVQHMLGRVTLSETQMIAADLNNDGNVSIIDVILLREMLLKN